MAYRELACFADPGVERTDVYVFDFFADFAAMVESDRVGSTAVEGVPRS